MKLLKDGPKHGYFVLSWPVNGVEMSKTVDTRGEVYALVRSLKTIGLDGFTIERTVSFPIRVED